MTSGWGIPGRVRTAWADEDRRSRQRGGTSKGPEVGETGLPGKVMGFYLIILLLYYLPYVNGSDY